MSVAAAIWSVAVALAMAGLGLVLWPIVRRAAPAWACRRCRYDLRGGSGAICPECGSTAGPVGRGPWRSMRWLMVPAGLTLISAPILLWKPTWAEAVIRSILPRRVLAQDTTFGGVRVRLYRPFELPRPVTDALAAVSITYFGDINESRVLIESRGRAILDHRDPVLWLGESGFPPGVAPAWGVNQDIDGDSVPDLIVGAYSGGAHCCASCFVIRLGEDPRITAEFRDVNGGPALNLVTGSDGSLQTIFKLPDDAWLYWRAPYSASAHAEVLFRLSCSQLSIAADLMARPLPSPQERQTHAARVKALLAACFAAGNTGVEEFSCPGCAELWQTALDLLYSGHEAEAFEFIDQAWPDGGSGREAFIREFQTNLAGSKYQSQVRAAFAQDAEALSHPPDGPP